MNKAFCNFVGLEELMTPPVEYVDIKIPLKIREDILHDLRVEYQRYIEDSEFVSEYSMSDYDMARIIGYGVMIGDIPLYGEKIIIDTHPETLEILKYIDMVYHNRASLAKEVMERRD